MEYVIDGEVLTVDCLMCAVCNGRAYGGGFMAGPEAQPDDGWLDVFIVRKVSRRVIAKLLMLYKNGQHFQNGQLTEAAKPYFIYRRAKSVSLRAADGRGPIIATVDGECAPASRCRCRCSRWQAACCCRCPPTSALPPKSGCEVKK